MQVNYRTEPLARYLDDAASARPTPGGGSVTAVAAALASTMASMAAGFTVGKERFKDVAEEVTGHLERLAALRDHLLEAAHRDMAAYQGIMAAWRLPKDTPEQEAARAEAIRSATRASLDVVESVLAEAGEILTIARRLADIANPNLASDVAVAAELALGAVRAAAVNVAVNLAGYTDAADAEAIRSRTDDAVIEAERLAVETRGIVLAKVEA